MLKWKGSPGSSATFSTVSTPTGHSPSHNPALQRALTLSSPVRYTVTLDLGTDAFRSIEETRVHDAARQCGGMAAHGARAAACEGITYWFCCRRRTASFVGIEPLCRVRRGNARTRL